MAARYIVNVADATALANFVPHLPGVAGIAYQEDIDALVIRDPASGVARRFASEATAVQTIRRRFTIAEINAGAVSFLAARAGKKYRMVDVQAIAIGGAVGTVTTVDVLGVQATSSVKLAAFGQAALTQSTVLRPGISGTTVLADGASFVACDVNTAITVSKTGGAIDTATHIDIELKYVVEEG